MDLPQKYSNLIDEIISRALKYAEKGKVLPPVIIKGGPYSGAYIINREIYKKINIGADKNINTMLVGYKLTGSSLTSEISNEVLVNNQKVKKPTIVFIDGIDRLLNLSTKDVQRGAKRGRGAKSAEIIDESHSLRKLLLENSNKLSIIASSGDNPSFMENPDLPFYKFFNEINVSPLSPQESAKYVFNQLKKNSNFDIKMEWLSDLGSASFEWPYRLTGGNLILLQRLIQVASHNSKMLSNANNKSIKVQTFLDEYFFQIQPLLYLETELYSREELRFIELAALADNIFSLKNIGFGKGNTSLVAKKLVEKNMLSPLVGSIGRYFFTHIALRTFIRYFANKNLSLVLSDSKLLK